MNNDIIMGGGGGNTATNATTSSDLQLCPVSPDGHDIFRPTADTSDVSAGNIQPITIIRPHQNPRKKRTKMIRIHNSKAIVVAAAAGGGSGPSGSHSGTHSGVVTKKKPDPSAPKITSPCTECGKRFWSLKALFGHMRCHPERPWRGINPPPNLHHPPPDHRHLTGETTKEDEHAAACLLMLANSPTLSETTHNQSGPLATQMTTDPETRFECSSCKKVFGSHQALGGHRASHKNVKGCFAITRTDGQPEELEEGEFVGPFDINGDQQQHKCSICSKIFSSGQALGGHKRCHWEKEDGVVPTASTSVLSHPSFRFNLNLPADESISSSLDLDLRLRL